MPTLTCIFYLLCLGVVYLFRTFYQGWAIPYLLLAMAAAPVLICLLSLPAMLKTELRMEGKPYVMKGERGEARFFFRSKRLLPVGRISLTIVFENHYTRERFQTQELFYSVSGGEARTILYPTDSCGKISFRITRFECRDLLGFFAVRRKCREMFSATVLPASVGPEKHLDIDAACNREVRLKPKYGGGFSEDYDLRDYRPGDMGNSIHWKLSSKADRLIVKEALVPENEQIFVVLADVGEKHRGLEVLRWLLAELNRREVVHTVVSGELYPVENEQMGLKAITEILSSPAVAPCSFDDSRARCIFRIEAGEVSVL